MPQVYGNAAEILRGFKVRLLPNTGDHCFGEVSLPAPERAIADGEAHGSPTLHEEAATIQAMT